MSLHYYTEKEEYLIEESINNYKYIFIEYSKEPPSLSDSLKQMFISYGATEEKSKELIKDIISKIDIIINRNLNQIKEKYPRITLEDSKIISSYTCESKDKKFSPYKILNENLISDNRKESMKNISKYLFIFLKSLRKLPRYYPNKKEKYLYRFINSKVNLDYDKFNKKIVPYIVGNTRTFWGFISSYPDIKMTNNFFDGEKNNKSSTIFTLTGKVWGYDITLFNYYNEKEILIEPERKFKVDEIIPPFNEIIHIRCDMQDSPLVIEENFDNINSKIFTDGPKNFNYFLKYIIIGDYNVGKSYIFLRFLDGQFKPEYQLTIGKEFGEKNIEINNKIYRLQIWDTSRQENVRSITKFYYKNSVCAIIVYDISSRYSFENISTWIEDCKNQAPKNIIMILVGNNCELEKREVTYEEGKLLADKYGMLFYEASAKTGQNINDIFYDSAYEISKKIDEGFYDLESGTCGIQLGFKENESMNPLKPDKNENNCSII